MTLLAITSRYSVTRLSVACTTESVPRPVYFSIVIDWFEFRLGKCVSILLGKCNNKSFAHEGNRIIRLKKTWPVKF